MPGRYSKEVAAGLERRVVDAGFHERVYALVRQVPPGALTTYGDIATCLGSPRVARHVGWALAALKEGVSDVPWHRVINGQGRISYRGDVWRASAQAERLESEGIPFDDTGKVIDFRQRRWRFPDLSPESEESPPHID